jgi:hypothetical protein
MNIDQIANEALQLDLKDRAMLAETIWESLEDPYFISADVSDEESIRLAKQRDDEIKSGDVKPISHKELMNRQRRDCEGLFLYKGRKTNNHASCIY